jgi:CubicO group peptidase (beta-lactamase class C family)
MVHSSDLQHAPIAELVPELDRLAVDAMADWKVRGAAIAVVQGGKVVLAKAYGQRDVEAKLPVTATTQFVIGSITKSFTATGGALLHERLCSRVRLRDPVATERATIRDLLYHQSGLPRHDWVHLPGDRAPGDLLSAMRYLELSLDIRAAYRYNNLCYNVAGLTH